MSDRLLYVFWDFPRLSESFIAQEIGWLSARGFTIDVLAKRIRPQVLGLFPELRLDMVMPLQSDWGGRLQRAVSPWVVSAAVDRLSYAQKFRLSRVSPRDYRAIIAHFGPMALTACDLRRRLGLEAPVIGVFHGYDMSEYVARKGRRSYRDSEIDAFVAISEHWAERLRNMQVASEKIFTNHLGIDLATIARFSANAKCHERDPTLRLVSAGRLVEKKGYEILLRAIATLSGEVRSRIQLEIVGEGPDRSRLVKLAKALGIDSQVSFLGAMTHADLLARVASADLFVLASRTAADGDMEGIPVVLMEAMVLRVPIVSTTHSGIPELVEDGVSGTLVPEGDASALANAIAAFVQDPSGSLQPGEAAYNRVATQFTFDRYGERLRDVIERTNQCYFGAGEGP